ncbi:MAG: 50S ribosomal protein L23 [Burkholderiales bacterium]|nr:50S ribosomal protein L23 [Burkholderiales bacterium]
MAENAYNKYTFYVDLKANKIEIRNAIQEIFEVTVTNVTTTRVPSKTRRRGRIIGRTPERKKAVVTLKQGDRIEVAGAPLFES